MCGFSDLTINGGSNDGVKVFLQLAFQAQPTAVTALAHPQTYTTPSLR